MSPHLRSQLRDSTEKILANRHWLNQFLPAPSLPSLVLLPFPASSLPSEQGWARYETGVPKTFFLLGPEINICFFQCKYPSVFNEVISGHFLALLSAWKSLSIWEKWASCQVFPIYRWNCGSERAIDQSKVTQPEFKPMQPGACRQVLLPLFPVSWSLPWPQPTAPCTMTGRQGVLRFPSLSWHLWSIWHSQPPGHGPPPAIPTYSDTLINYAFMLLHVEL